MTFGLVHHSFHSSICVNWKTMTLHVTPQGLCKQSDKDIIMRPVTNVFLIITTRKNTLVSKYEL